MLFAKPVIKALIHQSKKKSKKNYGALGTGKKSLTKDEERSQLFDENDIKSDSLNIDVKDYSSFKHENSNII